MNNIDKTRRSNMGYFLACRTNVTSTLRLLKRVCCYTKLVFSLKWLGLSAGEISRLNMIAHISKNIRIRENGLIFSNTPRWDLSFGTLKRTKFQNVMVLYLTEINSSLKWRLLYRKNTNTPIPNRNTESGYNSIYHRTRGLSNVPAIFHLNSFWSNIVHSKKLKTWFRY